MSNPTPEELREQVAQTMPQIEFTPGLHIDSAAVLLVGEANKAGAPVSGRFNDIVLTAEPGERPEAVSARYAGASHVRAARWRASPEGRRRAAERLAEVADRQAVADQLAAEALDFTDEAAVLTFLCALQPASDDVAVKVNAAPILAAFGAAGLTPNMAVGDDFRGDRGSTYRWLVGQALDGLESIGAIHPMILSFADKWRQEAALSPTQPEEKPHG